MQPLFSVIIPVYNTEGYLDQCVQSVLKQDFKDLEIILIDDCSTDKSNEICASLSKRNKSIKVIRHERNSGVSASRNSGIRAASGKYIIFLDSDDYLLEACLYGIAKLIDQKPDTDVIMGKFICKHENDVAILFNDNNFDSEIMNNGKPDDAIAHIKEFADFYGCCWRYIINRSFLIENNLFFIPAVICEDQEFIVRLLCLCRKFAFYDDFFYCYRTRAFTLTHHKMDYIASLSCLQSIIAMCDFIKNNHLPDVKKEFIYSRIKVPLDMFIPRLFVHNREEIYELSKIIDTNIGSLRVLENMPCGLGMYFFINQFGAYYGLILYKTFLTFETISQLKKSAGKEIYVFCVSIYGEAVAVMLRNEGYNVKGLLDNNKTLEGSFFSGFQVSLPSVLSDKSKNKLADIFVLICSQRKNVIQEITRQLEEIGLKKEQITYKIFDEVAPGGRGDATTLKSKDSSFNRL